MLKGDQPVMCDKLKDKPAAFERCAAKDLAERCVLGKGSRLRRVIAGRASLSYTVVRARYLVSTR